jgi:UDPglucose 6-dehydrogenase
MKRYYKGDLKGKHFALWGLAFKPDTDDIREAPALYMIDALLAAGATVCAFDPEAMENVRAIVGDKINYAGSVYETLDKADALLIATEWALFRSPDFKIVEERLKEKVIFDGRNLYSPSDMKKLGYHYESIGRN